ncbi:MAG: MGMT family protein, partial [Thiothrix sp.]
MDTPSKYQRIYAVVRQIPHGKVATYGDIAALAGLPGHARLVGYALHALPALTDVPWQRVINAKGGISLGRAYPGGELRQRSLLENEGVMVDNSHKIDLNRYRWKPN